MVSLLLPVLTRFFASDVERRLASVKRNSMLIALAAVFLITAYVFAVVAASLWLAMRYGAVEAAAMMACGFTVAGVAVIVALSVSNARLRQLEYARRQRMETGLGLYAQTAATLFRDRPFLAAGLALGAIVMLSASGSRRDD